MVMYGGVSPFDFMQGVLLLPSTQRGLTETGTGWHQEPVGIPERMERCLYRFHLQFGTPWPLVNC